MRKPTLTACSTAKLAAWPAVAEDREGCTYLVLMHPQLVTGRRAYTLWWCLAVLAAMAGAILG